MSILLVLVLLTACAAPETRAGEKKVSDDWYAVYMSGVKVGWSNEKVVERELEGEPVTVSILNSKMVMARMGTEIEIVQFAQVVEDAKGCLVAFTSRQKKSAMSTVSEGKVKDGKLVLTTRVAGVEQPPRTVDLGEGCLPPQAMKRLMKEKGTKAGTRYKTQIFMTEAPDRPVDVEVDVKGPVEVDILGTKRTLVQIDTKMVVMGMPMTTMSWIDSEWRAWKTSTMGIIETYRVPKELAMKPGEVREVFVQTIIPSNKLIKDARKTKRLVYRLELEGEDGFATFPTGLRQKVLRRGEGFIVVEIKASDRENGLALPVRAEGMDAYLASTAFLSKDDPRIEAMARATVGEETDALAAARKLEKKVFDAIKKKNFGVGFATASEVAMNLEGDCSEHAVLLAALCRAAGIPSRVVGGLIYADLLAPRASEGKGGFGFHLWTEVFVGSWVALDATLGDGFADATHIALAKSALESEASIFELVPLGLYMGKLKIKVLDE
jgi:hypothetical protein